MAELLDKSARESVADALLAYNAMETTKRRHFDYLNLLEAKRKKFNLSPTQEEQDLLASLLADHDQTVKKFKTQTQSLLLAQPDAHRSLFSYISTLNEALSAIEHNPLH